MARRRVTIASRIAAVVAGIIVTLLIVVVARAKDNGQYAQSENRDFFRSLTDQVGRSCCDGADGQRLNDPDWNFNGDSYKVRLDGNWIDIRPEQVVKQGNRVGFAVVWPYHDEGGVLRVRCFMPGSGA